jgi:WD40 repeat protein
MNYPVFSAPIVQLPRSPSGATNSNCFESWKTPLLFKCFGTFRGHHGFVNCLTVWNNKLISGGSDKMLKVWDLENLIKGCLLTVGGHVDAVSTLGNHLLNIPY